MSRFLDTKDRFKLNPTTVPFEKDGTRPLPTRNMYALFNDGGQDLFRHGLSEVNSNYDAIPSDSDVTVDYSPFGNDYGDKKAAKEDPVMFGFDMIIRTQESPLFSSTLQDSVQSFFESGFVTNDEMVSRQKVWNDFKKTFFQFFRSSLETQPAIQTSDDDNPTNSRFYYYLNKVSGLDNLVENNTMQTPKSFIDYGKDTIKLNFTEDVTLRIGRMAALYKSLYWSRMSGKTLIPENLLRFDCDIIISEVRNFVKLKKVVESDPLGGMQTLKDNVNRYVYTIYDCQLFFDKIPHGDVVDIGTQLSSYEGFEVGFTYKHSTLRVDAFNPITDMYDILNNGAYDPKAFTNFDKFLLQSVPVNKTDSTIGSSELSPIPDVIVDVVNLRSTTKDNGQSNTNQTNPTTTDGMGTDADGNLKTKSSASGASDGSPAGAPNSGNDIESAKLAGQEGPSIEDMKKDLVDNGNLYNYKRQTDAFSREGITPGTSVADQEAFERKNKELTEDEIEASKTGAPKESWLKSNTSGARFAKRIANTGIAAVNRAIAKRTALLTKTLNDMTVSAGYKPMLPPENIYTTPFNGELYLSSKIVRDAFENFVGESISSLFNKGKRPI